MSDIDDQRKANARMKPKKREYGRGRSLAQAPGSAIRCLGAASTTHWPHKNNRRMEELWLAGKIEVEPSGESIWWLDEQLQQHSRFVPRGEPVPEFILVERRGLKVTVRGIADYTLEHTSPNNQALPQGGK